MESLAAWLERQYGRAVQAMLASISAVGIVKTRPGFGQIIRPARGSIVASPVLAAYDPDPDYFFHWYRDSAVVMDALRLPFEDGSIGSGALDHFADFVRFSRALLRLDGRELVTAASWRERVAPDYRRFLRTEADLEAVHGEHVAGETRVNPDGTLDVSSWGRPQYDGPALRALALLRWGPPTSPDAALGAEWSALLRSDLDFTWRHWREPSFDIWEEEKGTHYYTVSVGAAALQAGAAWLEEDEPETAGLYRSAVDAMRAMLDGFWSPEAGHYRSRVLPNGAASTKELDIAVILAAIHTAPAGAHSRGAHSAADPRVHATLARLEALFDASYTINRSRPQGSAPAMGRYAGDVYYSGGAYYFSTLAAAELCFRAAAAHCDDMPGRNAGNGAGGRQARGWIEHGDGFLATVRAYTPPDGQMSEQFDQHTGAQSSARHLAWSYASLISCVAARRAALASVEAAGRSARAQSPDTV
ncbi:MAG TPA: glycoside hydrolase family 15 protein [Steroidobacteraceae bacterium]